MKKGQKHIYYISGETKDAVEKSPFLERLRKKDLEVLYYVDPIDEYAMPQLTEFKGFQFMGANKENLKFDDDEAEEKKLKKLQETHKKLTDWLKETLGSKVEKAVVSNRLLETPAIIVSSQYGWSTNMERIMKAQTMGNQDRSNAMVSQKTLEINPHHPVMQILLERVKEGNGDLDEASVEYADLMFNMAILNSGFIVENPMDLTEPLEKLIKVGFGLSRDAPIEEIEVNIDDSEDDEESGDSGEDIDLDYDDEVDYEEMMIDDL